MFKFFRRIWRGAGYLEGYGHHPGTGYLIGFPFVCGIAGISKGGLSGFIGGYIIGLVGIGIPFMAGCWSRARDYELDAERTFKLLQKDYK